MSLLEKIVSQAKELFDKAEQAIEGERYIPISQASVNGLLERYVVAKVSKIITLKTDIKDHDFLLTGKIEAKGIIADVSSNFEVVSFIFNDHIQRLIFKQVGETHIEKIAYEKVWMQPLVKLALIYCKFFLKRDPLGVLLEKFGIATCNQNELTFDLNKYFDEDGTVIKNLKRFHVTDAKIENSKLHLLSRINMSGFFPDDDTTSKLENNKEQTSKTAGSTKVDTNNNRIKEQANIAKTNEQTKTNIIEADGFKEIENTNKTL